MVFMVFLRRDFVLRHTSHSTVETEVADCMVYQNTAVCLVSGDLSDRAVCSLWTKCKFVYS